MRIKQTKCSRSLLVDLYRCVVITYWSAYGDNPSPELLKHENPLNIINARIQCCANMLRCSPQKIQDWLYVKSVLYRGWWLYDYIERGYFKQFIRLLD